MASFNKFNIFTYDTLAKKHDFTADVFKVALSNTAPGAANAVLADITQISAGNGYTSGGTATSMSLGTSSGTAKATGTDVVFTASGGSIGPTRYAVLYNSTAAGGPLVGWWDYGSSVTLATSETLTVDFDATNGILTIV